MTLTQINYLEAVDYLVSVLRYYFIDFLEEKYGDNWPSEYRRTLLSDQLRSWEKGKERGLTDKELIDIGNLKSFAIGAREDLKALFKSKIYNLPTWFDEIAEPRNLFSHVNSFLVTDLIIQKGWMQMISIAEILKLEYTATRLRLLKQRKEITLDSNAFIRSNRSSIILKRAEEKAVNDEVIGARIHERFENEESDELDIKNKKLVLDKVVLEGKEPEVVAMKVEKVMQENKVITRVAPPVTPKVEAPETPKPSAEPQTETNPRIAEILEDIKVEKMQFLTFLLGKGVADDDILKNPGITKADVDKARSEITKRELEQKLVEIRRKKQENAAKLNEIDEQLKEIKAKDKHEKDLIGKAKILDQVEANNILIAELEAKIDKRKRIDEKVLNQLTGAEVSDEIIRFEEIEDKWEAIIKSADKNLEILENLRLQHLEYFDKNKIVHDIELKKINELLKILNKILVYRYLGITHIEIDDLEEGALVKAGFYGYSENFDSYKKIRNCINILNAEKKQHDRDWVEFEHVIETEYVKKRTDILLSSLRNNTINGVQLVQKVYKDFCEVKKEGHKKGRYQDIEDKIDELKIYISENGKEANLNFAEKVKELKDLEIELKSSYMNDHPEIGREVFTQFANKVWSYLDKLH